MIYLVLSILHLHRNANFLHSGVSFFSCFIYFEVMKFIELHTWVVRGPPPKLPEDHSLKSWVCDVLINLRAPLVRSTPTKIIQEDTSGGFCTTPNIKLLSLFNLETEKINLPKNIARFGVLQSTRNFKKNKITTLAPENGWGPKKEHGLPSTNFQGGAVNCRKGTPQKNSHDIGKSQFSMGNTSLNG